MRDLCQAFRDGKLPNSMTDDCYYQRAQIKRCRPHERQANCRRHRWRRLHRQPHGGSAARARLSRCASSTTWSAAASSNLAHHNGQPRSRRSRGATSARWSPATPLFKGARYVFHFAGIGDIVPSIERPMEYMSVNVQGTVRVLEAARHAGSLRKLVYAASSSCYGLADDADARGPPDPPAIPLRAHQVPGRAGGVPLAQGLQAAGRTRSACSTPTASRSRTTGAYGAVFGVFLRQKLAGKPFTVVGDGTQRRDFVYVTDVATAFLAAAESPIAAAGLQPRRRQSADRQSPGRAARRRGVAHAQAAGRAGRAPGPTSRASQADLGWRPQVSFEEGVSRMLANIDYWREAPLWDPESIAKATKTWFETLSADGEGRVPLIDAKYKAKIKTIDELRAAIGPRPRKRKVIMCHGTFDIVHPGHIRHLMYAEEQGRRPDRQPDRRRAHHQGQLPPVRAAGAARPEPGGARDGRLT